MSDSLEVWMDADFLPLQQQVGTLHNDNGQLRFVYSPGWLSSPHAFNLDPDLSLDKAPFFPRPEVGNFGVFLDSSPDRWGQTLMQRREALEAKDAGRKPRNLYAWDYLLGVQDATRQGAFRFKHKGCHTFLDSHPLAAPPVTSLQALEQVAQQLSTKKITDLDALRRWLSVLVAPGASLGGARPKANFTQPDGSLWIAKFPARDDDRDVGAWEGVAHTLATAAGIQVAKTVLFGKHFHTFCVQRFDRQTAPTGARRVFYASAMTMLQKTESEGTSYLELAQFIQRNGSASHIKEDLAQLFKRVAFNVALGNRDDHLRNHGFVLTHAGWRLAPAFDVNPNIHNSAHTLNIDDQSNLGDLHTVRSTASLYGLSPAAAEQTLQHVVRTVATWPRAAQLAGISAADIDLTAGAFSALESWVA
jgi:serine/threonine-protein kinase HipA